MYGTQMSVYLCVFVTWICIGRGLCHDLPADGESSTDNGETDRFKKDTILMPVFSEVSYHTSVLENQPPGKAVIRVLASVPGVDVNVTYGLKNCPSFAIDPASGVVTTDHSVDRESIVMFNCEAIATATEGLNNVTSRVVLTISVVDVNDNAPVFTRNVYNVSVLENVPMMTTLTTVTATDMDVGVNGLVRYSISTPTNMVTIDPVSGRIQTTQPLDAEAHTELRLTVEAADLAPLGQQLSSTTEVIVNIEDVNDNFPRFTQSTYSATIIEELPSMTPVIKVHAYDMDSGTNAEIHYSLKHYGISYFTIDPLSGLIKTTLILDREVQPSYELYVIAVDQGSSVRLSTTATVNITVLDVNDNAPQFTNSLYKVIIQENINSSEHPIIFQASAIDYDVGRNAQLTYSILHGNTNDTFYIDPATGAIHVQKPLHYQQQREFTLTIQAKDNGINPLTTHVNVDIRVIKNLNPPTFTKQIYETNVSEAAALGTLIMIVRAVDTDSDRSFNYRLPTPHVPFTIDTNGGQIMLTSPLDREMVNEYQFTVQVLDKVTYLSSNATVKIHVIDENDNAPVFINTQYTVHLAVDSPQYQLVTRLIATDGDIGSNGVINYAITGGNTGQTFMIDQQTGTVRLARQLTMTGPDRYHLAVRAQDMGTPALFSIADLEIIVAKTNPSGGIIG